MPDRIPDLAVPVPLALAATLGTIAALAYAVRLYGRRQRRCARRQRRELTTAIRRFLDGAASSAQVARAAAHVDEASFWTVLESPSLRLAGSQWLRLSRALVHSRHAAVERRALADDSPWRRMLAARRLALVHSRASRRSLRRAMTRGPEMVTLTAATALARYHDRRALCWILAHPEALAHRHRNALAALLRAFGRRGLPVITGALERGTHVPRLALAMADTLGLCGHRPARSVLERRLADGDLDMRAAAARALGSMRAVECATSLIAALRDQAWQVRAQAARALGRAGAQLATHALASRLSDPSWWVRHHSAYALRELGEDGRAALRHVIATSGDPYARDMAREALDGGATRLSA